MGVVDLGAGVIHGHVDAHLVEGSDERASFAGVGAVGDDIADTWRDLVRLQGELQSDRSGRNRAEINPFGLFEFLLAGLRFSVPAHRYH